MSDTSMQAFLALEPKLPKRRMEVFLAIGKSSNGLTIAEASKFLDRPQHALSGRFTELHKSGFIKRTDERRGRQTVYQYGDGRAGLRKKKPGRFMSGKVTAINTEYINGGIIEVTVQVKDGSIPDLSKEVSLTWN